MSLGTITVVPDVDLAITAVSGLTAGVPGGNITISDTVSNQGNGNVANFYVDFYLSIDNMITDSDIWLGNRLVTALAGKAINNGNTTMTIPTTIAIEKYYAGAIVDLNNQVMEKDETNNTLAGILLL